MATGNGAPVLTPEDMLSQFAACVTRRDPAGVRDFVLATPATDHEDQALAAITPQFGSCVVQGSKLQINKATLASYLAEALYLQATTPASVAIAGAPR